MKKNQIKQIIESEIKSHLPEHAPKMDFNLIADLRAIEDEKNTFKKPSLWLFMNLRRAMSLTLILVLTISTILLLNTQEPSKQDDLPSGAEIFEKENEALSVSFLSNAMIIPSMNSSDQNNQPIHMLLNSNQNITTTSIEILKPFLNLVESIISQNNQPIITVLESTNDLYDTFILIESFDLLGEKTMYKMYYNVVAYEVTSDESTFRIEGIMIIHNVTYSMIGEKTVEDDEIKVVTRTAIDDVNYIETIYEMEAEESSYVIVKVQDGRITSRTTLDIEISSDEIEIEFHITTDTTIAYYKLEYEIEDDQPVLEIEFEIENRVDQRIQSGEMRIRIHIDQITNIGEYNITIKVGDDVFEDRLDRDNYREDDEDDDDDDEDDDDDDEDDDEYDDEDSDIVYQL